MNPFRSFVLLISLFAVLFSLPAIALDGSVVKIDAKNSATETVDKLKRLVTQKGFKIYSVIDHGDRQSVKKVIAFGKESHNARIMWHDPAAGLELPLKIAVFQDEMGDTQLIYRKPTALRKSYSVDACRLIDDLDNVMEELALNASQ